MKRTAKKAQLEREAYFYNLHCQNALMNIGKEMDKDTEGFSRLAAIGAMLLGLLLMAPGVLKMFGHFADSVSPSLGFGLCDWLLLTGLLIVAGVFAWIGFWDEFTGWAAKRIARQKPDAERRKNIGRTGGDANGGRKRQAG